MSSVSDVLDAALALNTDERAEVVHSLLRSLEPAESDNDVEAAWAKEIQRRRQAIRDGKTKLRDWDDALNSIRSSLNPGEQAWGVGSKPRPSKRSSMRLTGMSRDARGSASSS